MERLDISLNKGLHRSPSFAAGGELAECVNLIPHQGELRNIPRLENTGMTVGNGYRLLAVHSTQSIKHYIFDKTTGLSHSLAWADEMVGGGNLSLHDITGTTTNVPYRQETLVTIGNTMVYYNEDGVHYYLWREGAYTSLGNKIPELTARPYLKTRLMNHDALMESFIAYRNPANSAERSLKSESGMPRIDNGSLKNLYDWGVHVTEGTTLTEHATRELLLTGASRTNIYNRVFTLINRQTELIKHEGYFFAPFLVRLAWRMYDGTHVMQTPAILLTPNTIGKPVMKVVINKSGDNYNAIFDPVYAVSTLYADIVMPEGIEKWRDLITHVDVFVTPQSVDYTDNEQSVKSVRFNSEMLPGQTWSSSDHSNTGRIMSSDENGNATMTSYHDLDESDSLLVYEDKYLVRANETIGVASGFGGPGLYCYLVFDTTNTPELEVSVAPGQIGPLPTVLTKNDLSSFGDTIQLESGVTDCKFMKIENYDPAFSFTVSHDVWVYKYIKFSNGLNATSPTFLLHTERVGGKRLAEVVKEEDNFRLISSIQVGADFHGKVEIKKGLLKSLEMQSRLSDLGGCRRTVIPSSSIQYNNRLNMVVEKETLPNTIPMDAFISHRPSPDTQAVEHQIDAVVMCLEAGQTAYKKIPQGMIRMLDKMIYFSYPDACARKLLIRITIGANISYQSIPLEAHPTLDMAVAFDEFNDVIHLYGRYRHSITNKSSAQTDFEAAWSSLGNGIKECYIEYGNKIIVSPADNPFVFREDQYHILHSDVLALCTTTQSLSTQNFGQFPLYAFCSNGIWALAVRDDGTYAPAQPVSHDVCNNPRAVTQLDHAIAFTTAHGLMLLSERGVTPISDVLDGTTEPIASMFAPLTDYLNGFDALLTSPHPTLMDWNDPSLTMAYDAQGALLRIFAQGRRQLVWSITESAFASQVDGPDGVPAALVQGWPVLITQQGGTLYRYPTHNNDAVECKGFILTRVIQPAGLSARSVISQIKLYHKHAAWCRMILFGGNEPDNWRVVTSLKSASYKYYCIAVLVNMNNEGSISGLSLMYEPRYTGKLR